MTLKNLERARELQSEAPDKREFDRLVQKSADRLRDAENAALSYSSRFDLAYSAAHGLALAALRAAGYRTDKRYLVFQCLVHTVKLDKSQLKIFTASHERRNLAEYEGLLESDESFLVELIRATKELMALVEDITVE